MTDRPGDDPGADRPSLDQKRESARSFGAAADTYLSSETHRQGSDLERLVDWCDGAERALDVATGAGHTAGALRANGVSSVVAADAASEMVATATEAYDGLSVIVADAERLPVADDAVEAVTCRIAAHHFPDPVAFLEEVARVLEPGGTFAFEDNVAPSEPELASLLDRVERTRDPTHVASHPTDRWLSWLEEAGFVVRDVRHVRTELPFHEWVAAPSPSPDRRRAAEQLLLEAGPEASEAFRIRTEDGAVRSWANLKALIRAERRADANR